MTPIRLLAAPAAPLPAVEAHTESTSLIPANNLALAIRRTTPAQMAPLRAYTDDPYVWSASTEEDAYAFYTAHLGDGENAQSGETSGRAADFFSASVIRSYWSALNSRIAVAQYTLLASVTAPIYGHLVDVYA